MLEVSFTPGYADVDYVEVVSSVSSGGYYITFEQMVAMYEISNTGVSSSAGNFLHTGYYATYTSAKEDIEYGIRAKRAGYVYDYNGTEIVGYEGKFYFKTIIPTVAYGETKFTITVTAYSNGVPIEFETPITKLITVTRSPSISLTLENGDTNGIIAFGTSTMLVADGGDLNIEWSIKDVTDPYNVIQLISNPLPVGKTLYQVSALSIDAISASGIEGVKNYIGHNIRITAKVTYSINNRNYMAEASVTLKLTLFMVNSISVKNVVEGKFIGTYNQPYDLRVSVSAIYDPTYTAEIENILALMGEKISSSGIGDEASSTGSTFYLLTADHKVKESLTEKQYDDFIIERIGNYYSIRNNIKDTSSTIRAMVEFGYTLSDSVNAPYGITCNSLSHNSDEFTYSIYTDFTLSFASLSNEENPEPIYTAEELANMSDGDYYILLSDIVLEDWTPIDTAIASLDGNGYVITIKNFDYEVLTEPSESSDSELVLGLFSEISADTIIKNLTVEVATADGQFYDEISAQNVGGHDIYINAQYYSNITYGTIAATNYGTITNVNVVHNANRLRNEREYMLFQRGLVSYNVDGFDYTYANLVNEYNSEEYPVDKDKYPTIFDFYINKFGFEENIYASDSNGKEVLYSDSLDKNLAGYWYTELAEDKINYIYTNGKSSVNYTSVSRMPNTDTYWSSELNGVRFTRVERKLSIIDVSLGEITAPNPKNRIGGFVGVNKGYITNSTVENVSIYGYDCVAGFVAENSVNVAKEDDATGSVTYTGGAISSSFFVGGNVHAQTARSEKKDDLGGAGFVFHNYENARISYSYVEALDHNIASTSGQNLSVYTESRGIRLLGSAVTTDNANSAGFIYNNAGRITDCYANILTYGTYSAGFVFKNENTGIINNVISYSAVQNYTDGQNPFNGTDTDNQTSLANGTINNAYYFIIENIDVIKKSQEAVSITRENLASYDSFTSFSFNADYSENDIQEIVESVWFIPTTGLNMVDTDGESIRSYFKKESYTANMPQLVSANLKTMSLKNYSSLAEYNIIESIYSSILVDDEYSVSLGGINRSNVRVSITDYPLATVANRLSADKVEIPSEFQGNYVEYVKAEIVGYKNITPTYDIAYESLEETTKVQYIAIDVYLPGTAYNSYKDNTRFLNNIKNWTLTNSSITGVVYLDLVLHNLDEVALPDSDASYQYYSILNNRFGVSIEYGGSVLNPYLIDSADNYNIYVMQTTESNSYAVTETKYRSESLSLRFVKDIAFNVGANLNAITYNVILSDGDIEGNGMYINQLRIDADTEKTNVQTDEDAYTISSEDFYEDETGKYVYVRYMENAVEAKYDYILESKISDTIYYDIYVYNSRTGEYQYLENYSMAGGKVTVLDTDIKVVRFSVATSLGMFAKITDNSIIRNLNINISEVFGTGINYVGVIAGQVISSKVYNVQIVGSGNIYVTGNNAVGGIAGRITGDSFIVNSNVSVSVEANYYGINNIFSSTNFNVDSGTFNLYASNYKYVNGQIVNTENPTSSNINEISYAGGIAGIVDVTAFEDSTDTNYSARIRECVVSGAITISGEVAGGLTGYAGINTVMSDSSVEIESGAHIEASRIAGGVVAHNNQGLVQRNYIAHGKTTQDAIDKNIKETTTAVASLGSGIYDVDHGVSDLFIGNPHYMGGIVGYNYLGSIEDSYGRVDVVNIDAEYAGGIVGLNVGGQLRDIYTTADVYGFRTVGGIIGLQTMQITIEDTDTGAVIVKNELLGVETVSNTSISAGTFINNNMHIANQHELVNPEYTAVITIDNGVIDSISSSSYTTSFTGVVAANLWTLTHLNVRRITPTGDVASNARIGSLVGCEYYVVINGETKSAIYVGELSSRIHEEHIYTIEAFTYDSIIGAGQYVLLNAIGNFSIAQETFTLTASVTSASTSSGINYTINNASGRQFLSGNYYSQMGDGNYSAYHFSRLSKYSSVRSLSEIVGRTADVQAEVARAFYEKVNSQIVGSSLKNEDGSSYDYTQLDLRDVENVSSIYVSNIYTVNTVGITSHKSQNIYSSSWSSNVWVGIGLTDENKPSDNYVFPELESQIIGQTIYVDSIEDLLLMNTYTSGTFILIDDVDLSGYEWVPLCSDTNPFTGTLKSKDGYYFTIRGLRIYNGYGAVGLISAIQGAKLYNFNLTVDYIGLANSSIGSSYVGAIYGKGSVKGNSAYNFVENVNVLYTNVLAGADGYNLEVPDGATVTSLGGAVGYSDRTVLQNVNVQGMKMLFQGQPDGNEADSLFIGGVAGYITLVNENDIVEDIINGTDVTSGTGVVKNIYSYKNSMNINITFTSFRLADMGVGGLFGGVDLYSTGYYKMQEVLSSNNSINVVIATPHNVNTVFTNNINVAGAMGIVYGSGGSKRDTLITINNISVVNTDVIFTDGSKTNNELNAVLAYNSTQTFDVFANINVAGAVGQVGFESRFKIDINNIYVDKDVNVSSTTIVKESQSSSVGGLLGRTSTNTVSGAIGLLYYNVEYANEGVDDNELNVYTMANVSWSVYEEEEIPYNITYVVGGAIAKSVYSRVNEVYFDGTISSSEDNVVSNSASSKLYYGGFIGYSNSSNITNTIADGDAKLYLDSVTDVGNFEAYVGGYAGFVVNNNTTNDIYSIDGVTTDVDVLVQNKSDSIKSYFGGFVGGMSSNEKINTVTNKIENSYSTGNFEISTDIDSTIGTATNGYESYYSYVGGFVGYAKGNVDVRRVYSINNFVLSSKATYDDEYKGGIVGYLDTRLSDFGTSAYYLIEFFPFGNAYGRGVSVKEMLYNSETTFASFDTDVWTVNNYSFPVLTWINEKDVCDVVASNLYTINYMDCFFSDSATDTETIESLANVNFKKCFGYNVNINTNNSVIDADANATNNALEFINFSDAEKEAETREYIASLGIDLTDIQKDGSRQNPELITDDGFNYVTNKSVIYTSSSISYSLFDVTNSTVYVENPITAHGLVSNSWINRLDKYSRLYGLNITNVANLSTVIYTNEGLVSTTTLNGADFTYIGTNNGRDFFNNIESTSNSSSKYIYQENKGLILYANIAVANSNLIQSYGNNSSMVLSVAYVGNVADVSTVIDTTGHILNSYFVYNTNNAMTDGTQQYSYFGQNGTYNDKISTLTSAQNISNYIDEYDFSKYWVMFTIDSSLSSAERVAREQGVAMFRWHLKLNIGKTWYFEDLDIYSTSQTAYSDYSWKNYANTVTSYSDADFVVRGQTFEVYTAKGFALVANRINNDIANYGHYNIKLVNAINLVGKLWTPIGSTGSFSGSVEGNGVNNICVLTNANAGLFANVEAENNTIRDISLTGGYVASFSNDTLNVGGLIGRVTDNNESGELSLIGITNSLFAVLVGYDYHNVCAPEYYVGGIVGSTSASMKLYTVYNYANIYNVKLAETNNSYTAGIIGNASIPNNSSKPVTITIGGDLREGDEYTETRVRNYGNVSRGYYVAGIIAYSNVDVKLENVTNYGYITGESQDESVVAGIIAVLAKGKLRAISTNINTYHVVRNEYINIIGGDVVGGIIGRTGENTEIDLREVYLYV
ncbi:MAG: hypothetical protein IJW28_01645 [Clostridia bacterium]|nr:hypothetical protein [Clostridia bacterium]